MGFLMILLFGLRRQLPHADRRARAVLDSEGIADVLHWRDAQRWKGSIESEAARVFCTESASHVGHGYAQAGVPTTVFHESPAVVVPDLPPPAPLEPD